MALLPLDGPSRQLVINIDNTTPQIFKRDANPLPERKVITVQALDGKIWIYFADDDETPVANDISTKGFLHFSKGKETYEASKTQVVWILSFAGTVEVRGAERA